MNERIRQLAEISIKESGQEFWWLTNNLVIEKFAELIVLECAQEFDNTYMSGGKTMGAYIREKFGVEE
jgi:hypothetical protein